MKDHFFRPKRRYMRLRNYNYSETGAYFVTICAYQKRCMFGEISDGAMVLNKLGTLIESTWLQLSDHLPGLALDEFVIMPNHLHGIVALSGTGVMNYASTAGVNVGARFIAPAPTSLGAVIRSFKARCTVVYRAANSTGTDPLWQRNYYEHVIRNGKSLCAIREYIVNNPAQWALDRENPDFDASAMDGRDESRPYDAPPPGVGA
ncbi:MAG: hypothetical protein QM808_05830 [Steroidobacteraceae bacterium]